MKVLYNFGHIKYIKKKVDLIWIIGWKLKKV